MKLEFITKIADLMTNPKSKHRVMPNQGEFRVGGSTEALGTFELCVSFEGNEMSLTGYIDWQHITMTKKEDAYLAKFQRRMGGHVCEPITVGLTNKENFIAFMQDWVERVKKGA
ncbi:hypothetical protein [Aeromonas phage AerS_266]|nr:hypothetical protein [Aeromonas phage AerS_266]